MKWSCFAYKPNKDVLLGIIRSSKLWVCYERCKHYHMILIIVCAIQPLINIFCLKTCIIDNQILMICAVDPIIIIYSKISISWYMLILKTHTLKYYKFSHNVYIYIRYNMHRTGTNYWIMLKYWNFKHQLVIKFQATE